MAAPVHIMFPHLFCWRYRTAGDGV